MSNDFGQVNTGWEYESIRKKKFDKKTLHAERRVFLVTSMLHKY